MKKLLKPDFFKPMVSPVDLSCRCNINENEPINNKTMTKIIIEKINGKWFVNDKPCEEWNYVEQKFFSEFLLAMKWDEQMKQYDINQLNKN